MPTPYEADVVAWSIEQAELLRSGKLSELDIEHVADEIESVGRSEQRELAKRMSILLAHLLKWQVRPSRRGASWEAVIQTQREIISRRIKRTPSLKNCLADLDWWAASWSDAIALAAEETELNLSNTPRMCPWQYAQLMDRTFFPKLDQSTLPR